MELTTASPSITASHIHDASWNLFSDEFELFLQHFSLQPCFLLQTALTADCICSGTPHIFNSLVILFLRELLSPPDCNNGNFVRILTAAARMWHQSHAKTVWTSITAALLLDSTKRSCGQTAHWRAPTNTEQICVWSVPSDEVTTV